MEILFIIILLITSVVGIAFIIERAIALRWNKVLPPAVVSAVNSCHTNDELSMLQRVCEENPSSLSRLILIAIEHLKWPKEENIEALQTHARQEIVKLERGLVVLEIVVGIAPLLGLVGTIFGLMTLFSDLGKTGIPDPTTLATGIAVILNSTLLGLLIAIPCLIAWNYFNNKVESMVVEMESLCSEFLRRQYNLIGQT
ncbi:MAG: MotA/TolQ/ExbB proton channel family protein [Verrucomicrobiia bacterium]